MGCAIVLKLAALHRGMVALVNVVEHDFSLAVAHYHKTQAISAADSRQLGTSCRVTQVTKIAQLVVSGI